MHAPVRRASASSRRLDTNRAEGAGTLRALFGRSGSLAGRLLRAVAAAGVRLGLPSPGAKPTGSRKASNCAASPCGLSRRQRRPGARRSVSLRWLPLAASAVRARRSAPVGAAALCLGLDVRAGNSAGNDGANVTRRPDSSISQEPNRAERQSGKAPISVTTEANRRAAGAAPCRPGPARYWLFPAGSTPAASA